MRIEHLKWLCSVRLLCSSTHCRQSHSAQRLMSGDYEWVNGPSLEASSQKQVVAHEHKINKAQHREPFKWTTNVRLWPERGSKTDSPALELGARFSSTTDKWLRLASRQYLYLEIFNRIDGNIQEKAYPFCFLKKRFCLRLFAWSWQPNFDG